MASPKRRPSGRHARHGKAALRPRKRVGAKTKRKLRKHSPGKAGTTTNPTKSRQGLTGASPKRRANRTAPMPSSPAPFFARHETFAPRHGWLTKGFQAAAENPSIFQDDEAPLKLGVGKNMARAIRYWCHAFKVLEPADSARRPASAPTDLGRALLDPQKGWDPFLEDVASLWLLHWRLISAPCRATAWDFAFTRFGQTEFTVDQLAGGLQAYVAQMFPSSRISPSSLRKDINCILRMYAEAPSSRAIDEETLACPFVELGLIRKSQASRTYFFDIGAKESLPPDLVVAACLGYAGSVAPEQRTIPAFRLLSGPGSPGMAFKLTESALCGAIEAVAGREKGLALSYTAGLLQMSMQDDASVLAHSLLRRLFTRQGAAA